MDTPTSSFFIITKRSVIFENENKISYLTRRSRQGRTTRMPPLCILSVYEKLGGGFILK